jgi:dipeptidyl aminopeptidase/acylaminoacyl peptidase
MTATAPLLPRRSFFGNPSRLDPVISPDGSRFLFAAPVDGVLNIWTAPRDDVGAATPLTRLSGRPIHDGRWSADGRYVLFARDANGDENSHVYAADAATGEVRDLTPFGKVSAYVHLVSDAFPDRILVGVNDRDPRWHDIWSVDLATGAMTLAYENRDEYAWIMVDHGGRPMLAARMAPEKGGEEWFRLADGAARPWRFIPFEDTMSSRAMFPNKAGSHLFWKSSLGRDKAVLIRTDLATDADTVVAEEDGADIMVAIDDPATWEVQAVVSEPLERRWRAVDPAVAPALDLLQRELGGPDFYLPSQSDDGRWWTIADYGSGPVRYHLLDRQAETLTELYCARPELDGIAFPTTSAHCIRARDGLDLVSYLTVPLGFQPGKDAPVPLVLNIHGGPWARDFAGYRRDNHWLANRGYAVLNVNYRGSWGFGKAFLNAGDKEHAGKMHDDLIDGVEWAIREGIADRDRVAIMGWSYGGYASFVGVTFTPEVFRCAVPIVGITDLVTLMENRPPYWASFMEHFHRRYADVRTEDGRAWLRSRSPLYLADRITKPLLIGHGANDVRCTVAQSDRIVEAMQARKVEVTYVVYPDEGHGFHRPENNLAFMAMLERFFARHLGGRCEPVGDDFAGSSHEIRAGAEFVA